MSEQKDYFVKCILCDASFEMTWGEDNQLCEVCTAQQMQNIMEVTNVAADPTVTELIRKLMQVGDFYSNPDNWRRFPVDEGVDANGSPVTQYFWIGDGGEFARKLLG